MHISKTANGEIVVGPFEDPAKVDGWRRDIGLEALTEYLERYRKENGGNAVRVLDD